MPTPLNNLTSLRIARPVTNLDRAQAMYCAGLDLRVIGRFEDHAGFDGVMLGRTDLPYHFEFTYCRNHPVTPSPTPEDITVFYLPDTDTGTDTDTHTWQLTCAQMLAAGFKQVPSFNPYWDQRGATFLDEDGYRTVLQNAAWQPVQA